MDYHFTPIINPKYPEDKKQPDWVIYTTGEYKSPKLIMTDLEARRFIQEFCDFHIMKVDLEY